MSTLQTDANTAGAPRPPPPPPPPRCVPNRLQNESEKMSDNKENESPELRTSERAIDGEVKQRPEQSRLAPARRAAEEQARRSKLEPKKKPMPQENGVGATSRLYAPSTAEQAIGKVKHLTESAKFKGAQRTAAQNARRLQTEREKLSGIKLYNKRPQEHGAVELHSTQVPVKHAKKETSEVGTSKSFAARQTVAAPPQSRSLPLADITNNSRDSETHGVQFYVESGANVCTGDHERIIADHRSEVERLNHELDASKSEVDRLNHELNASKSEVDRLNHELNASKSEVDRLNHELDASKASHDEKMRRFGDQVAILSSMISSPDTGGDDAGRGRAGLDGGEEDKRRRAARDGVPKTRQRGSDKLKYVKRACGKVAEHPGKMLVTMQDAFAGQDSAAAAAAAAIAALRDGSTVRGVMMGQIMAEVFARVGTKRLNQEQFVEWLISSAPAFQSAQVGGATRYFVLRKDGTKYSSPLTIEQSGFARDRNSLFYAATDALQASDNELDLALREFTSKSMTKGASRMHQGRAVYRYTLTIATGNAETQKEDKANKFIEMFYVGESTDVETRINAHMDHIFEPVDETTGATHQMGHRMARAAIAGADSPSAVKFQAKCLIALDEHSALLLAKSYVDFCRRHSKNVPSTSAGIMEVCRIIGAVGFVQEAFYTVIYNSLISESTDERLGMNYSQPGIIRTSSTSQFDQHLPLKEHRRRMGQERKQRQERPGTSGGEGMTGEENRRHFVQIALLEEGRDIRYLRWSDEKGEDTDFYAFKSGDAPGAEPRKISGDTPVAITMTPDGEGGRSEHARVSLENVDLKQPYGVITYRRFEVDFVDVNGKNVRVPVRREFFSVWIHDLPSERKYLDPTNIEDLHRPSAGNRIAVCTFLCENSDQAWDAARARCKFFNEAVGLPAESKEGAYPKHKRHKGTGQSYVVVLLNSSGRVGKGASARFYDERPPEVDMVYHVRCKLDPTIKPTPNRETTHAVAVERTYEKAYQAAIKHRQTPIVWNTTVREAIEYATSRESEVKDSVFWRPPPGDQ